MRYALLGILVLNLAIAWILFTGYSVCYPDFVFDRSLWILFSLVTSLEYLLYGCIRFFVLRKIPYLYEDVVKDDYTEQGMDKCAKLKELEIKGDLKLFLDMVQNDKGFNIHDWLTNFNGGFLPTTKFLGGIIRWENALKEGEEPPKLLIGIVSLNVVNHVNTFLAKVNTSLKTGGVFVCHCTTSGLKRERILKGNPIGLNYLFYLSHYIWHRFIPKLPLLKYPYFWITGGRYRIYPRVEVIGRLYRAGFIVLQEEFVRGEYYAICEKVKAPLYNAKPNTGPLIRLKRIGKNGKKIGVYKFRTMYAYSEYIQGYVYQHNNLQKGGKLADDYRVNFWGHFMRKYWLDELPMIVNLLKGDMKLVGVRPLSEQYFNLYSPELQKLRTKSKPGLLPPFYVDMPQTLGEIQESEMRYLQQYFAAPFATDWKYFWGAVKNIVVKGKRSK